MQISLSKRIAVSVLAVLMAIAFMPMMTFGTANAEKVIEVSSFSELESAVVEGGSIQLIDNISFSGEDYLEIKNDTTIDLNGFTLNSTTDEYSQNIMVSGTDGSLTIKDSKSKGSIIDEKHDTIGIFEGATLNIESGSIISRTGNAIDVWHDSILNIYGGKIQGTNAAISGNGTNDPENDNYGANTQINIYGGEITNATDLAIYHPQVGGKLNISGGIIKGKTTGIEARAGSVYITGGTIIGEGTETKAEANDNGSTSTGAGIALIQHNTKADLSLYVEGGTIKGTTAVYEANPQNNDEDSLCRIHVEIYGGSYDGKMDIEDKDKLEYVDVSDGTFSDESYKNLLEEGNGTVQAVVKNANKTIYALGETAIKDAAKDPANKITVTSGSITLENSNAVITNDFSNEEGEVIINGQEIKAGQTSSARSRDQLNKQVDELNKTISDLKKQIEALKTEAKKSNSDNDGKIKDLQKQLSDAQAALKSAQDQISANDAAYAVPGKVADLKAKAGKKKITLTWKKASNATGYKIYRATQKSGKYKYFKAVKNLKYVNKNLKKGKKYYYKVRAYRTIKDGQLFGAYSEIAGAKVK